MESVDCVVIGAGAIGLAVARELAQVGREVLVVEREQAFGTVTSARNSEVIHAGIHYPAGSLKARLCVAGRQMLYDYCAARGIAHRRCGKLIVATEVDQVAALESVRIRAAANGVDDLALLDRTAARTLEPALRCEAALHSPSTGIIDSHAYMLALLGDAERAGAVLALNSRVLGASAHAEGFDVHIETANEETLSLHSGLLVNAAGLAAPVTARSIEGLNPQWVPVARFAKGNYFTLAGRAPFSRLVYPLPVPGGLGVHLTLDMGGQARFGPDVEWLDIASSDQIDYAVDPGRGDSFYAEIRRYWPALMDGALQPAYSGVRPKIAAPGTEADFVIQGPGEHGLPGLVNLFGIESPGLTSSLAIAREVGRLLD